MESISSSNPWTSWRVGGYPRLRVVSGAGFADVADRIWRCGAKPGGIETRIAFYGDLFLEPGQQGDDPGDFTSAQSQFAEALAREWLGHVAERATKDKTRVAGQRERAYLSGQMGAEQGAGAVARSAIGGFSRISWFAPHGMGFAERFVNRALAQVTRYLTDDTIRSAAIDSVLRLVGPDTRVLIGHSLGSVVAYEAAHLGRERSAQRLLRQDRALGPLCGATTVQIARWPGS
ncbi:hypothetical protein [Lamprocystis purpurea]|uniref:hypothetical protein n=1 Tax=Lamprocystis purpurea TaxID=61598 RepID=UPI000684897A|nr:hypothetical protein [Lamprocystis purpurea]